MKKVGTEEGSPMREEYDFRGGVRGKYAARFREGTNLVAIAPDVAEVFPDSQSVNNALRVLAALIREHTRRAARG